MRKRARSLISMSVLVMMIGAIFLAVKPELSSAQNAPYRSYQLKVYCENAQVASATFWHDVGTSMGLKQICAGNCPGGTVPLAAALAGLPAEVSAALQAKVDKHQENAAAGNGRPLTCLRDGKEPQPEKKCENPLPWFDNSSTGGKGCKDVQALEIKVEERVVYLQMCGRAVFAHDEKSTDDVLIEAYVIALKEYMQSRVGDKVCCDRFREASRSDSSCDPRYDLDCDGRLNPSDRTDDGFPAIDTVTVAAGVRSGDFVPFPPWVMEDYKNFVPPANKCDCKWELLKSTRTCSPDGRSPHVYQARWRCPSSGNERFTRKQAPASANCGN